MDLRQIFLIIFNNDSFQRARNSEYNSNHPFFNLFNEEIPRSLETIADSFRPERQRLFANPYSFAASIGRGRLADIFWFGILDKKITNDPQEGVYVVYLVSYDGKSIYLSLIQAINGAVDNAVRCEETIERLRVARGELITKIDNRLAVARQNYAESFTKGAIDLSIDDNGNFFTAKAYQEASLYSKKYNCNEIPSEEDLRKDLKNMLNVYGQYRTLLNNERHQ